MNQRIKLLAEQAGFYPEDNWDHTNWHASGHNPLFEKFAELIVKECLFIIDDERKPEMVSRIELWKQVKQHFGV